MPVKRFGRKYVTMNYDFYSGINLDFVTDMFRRYANDEYKNHTRSLADDLGLSRILTYRVIKGYKDLSCFTFNEFKRILDVLGYKIQYRIIPK